MGKATFHGFQDVGTEESVISTLNFGKFAPPKSTTSEPKQESEKPPEPSEPPQKLPPR
jgi:hypothetical protein